MSSSMWTKRRVNWPRICARLGCEVVVTHPIDVRDNLTLYRLMGRLFAREAEAEALCARFEAAHQDADAAAAARSPNGGFST